MVGNAYMPYLVAVPTAEIILKLLFETATKYGDI